MTAENYRFKIGTFECIVVSDGTFAYPHPAQMFFANAPKERLAQHLRSHGLDPIQWDQYISPYPSLLINTAQHLVLVDTGAGDFAPTTGKLMPNLSAAGITAAQIDTVILTHGHPDHIGGNLDNEGKPAFPNARYVMWQEEWNFWTTGPDLSSLPVDDHLKQVILNFADKCLPPLKPRLDLIDRESAILPGIQAIAAPGHTPGHMALSISSNDEQLLAIVDTVLHPIHLEQPEWYSAVDLLPDKTVATRHRLLKRAVEEQALVFAYHFPAPGLGHIIQKEKTWQWQPLETS